MLTMSNGSELHDEIANWRNCLTGGAPTVRVRVVRLSPKDWCGRRISGTVGTYDFLIDEEVVKAEHGGGVYQIVVSAPDETGRYKYAKGGSAVIKIAGDPMVRGDEAASDTRHQRSLLKEEIERAISRRYERRLSSLESRLRRLEASS